MEPPVPELRIGRKQMPMGDRIVRRLGVISLGLSYFLWAGVLVAQPANDACQDALPILAA